MTYSDKFQRAVARTLAHEGGYVNDPDDPGSETYFGISKRSFPQLDIARLTREDAESIYFHHYWLAHGYEEIASAEIAGKIFDLCVNMGAQQAHICLQRACIANGHSVAEDGKLGPRTRTAMTSCPAEALMSALRSEAAGFYRLLAEKRPPMKKFLNGWLKRAYE